MSLTHLDVVCFVRIGCSDLFQGYSATILAYGQTCSGKSYTMEGVTQIQTQTQTQTQNSAMSRGLIPRVLASVLDGARTNAYPTTVTVSFYQIYLNHVEDLMARNSRVVVQEKDGKVRLPTLTRSVVTTMEDALKILSNGNKYRHVAATMANPESSRSHSVFEIVIQQRQPGSVTSVMTSKLRLVDLAGRLVQNELCIGCSHF
jgi:hypothetical protein